MQNIRRIVECIQTVLLILLVNHCEFALSQRQRASIPHEISKCTEYNNAVYEEIQTFSFFIHGAEEIKVPVNTCNKTFTPLIIGGRSADPQEFPHIARLGNAENENLNETKWFCGGTLISEKFVMTAAHCFYSTLGEVNIVRLGELDFSSDSDNAKPEDFTVRRNIIHPDYSDNSIYNDIGLIELNRSVVFNRYMHPACLPIRSGDEIEQLVAIGWGSTRRVGPSSTTLQKVLLDRFSYNRCRQYADEQFVDKMEFGLDNKSQLCAGSDEPKDSCSGDSGGPLLTSHNDYPCMFTVVGITSTGIGGCATRNVPAIYTRVYNYLEWIKQNVWE